MRAGAHSSMHYVKSKLSQQDAVNDVSSEVKLLTVTNCMSAVCSPHGLQHRRLSPKAPS